MITPAKLKLIHVAKRELGLDDDTYRAILRGYGGVDSARDLDDAGFDRVMACFTAHGFRSTWTKRTFRRDDNSSMATPRQVDLIRRLWAEWSDRPDDERALDHWLEHSFGLSALRFLDRAGAHKAITGLKAMAARKRDAA